MKRLYIMFESVWANYPGKRPQTVWGSGRTMDDYDDDVQEEDRSQDRDPHFVRACAVEMHLDIAQEPFCAEIYR